MNYGLKGTTEQFLALPLQQFIDALSTFVYGYTKSINILKQAPDIASQVIAWEDRL